MTDISILLDELFRIHEVRNAEKSLSNNQEPDFGLFDFVELREVLLSKIFRWMLDPTGTHKQGTIFLKKFIEILVTRPDDVFGFSSMDLEGATAKIEDVTENKRRLDIVLYHPEFIIAIENKLWAPDQKNQVYDYLKFLEKQGNGKRFLLIYLSPTGVPPTEESISKIELSKAVSAKSLQFRSYRTDIDEWLEECSRCSRSHCVRVFIDKLRKKLIDDIFEGIDMIEVNEIVQLIGGSAARLHSTMAIIANQKEIRKKLWNNFVEKFYAEVRLEEKWGEWEPDDTLQAKYPQIKLKYKKSGSHNFESGFIFFFLTGYEYFSGAAYGFFFDNFNDTTDGELISKFVTELSNKQENRPSYEIGPTDKEKCLRIVRIPPNDTKDFYGHNWAERIDPWLDMAVGDKIRKKLFDLANELSKDLNRLSYSVGRR